MNRHDTLRSLASLLESFLERVVELREQRLAVLDGISRLDDIARQSSRGTDITDEMGEWFAHHSRWLTDNCLKPTEVGRIDGILGEIRRELRISPDSPAALRKIDAEIDRWSKTHGQGGRRLVLERPPEDETPTRAADGDTIAMFEDKFSGLLALYKDHCGGKKHLLSVLDDLLGAAKLQKNTDALILSALVIYYLKQNGYKVEPYVRKLRAAETSLAGSAPDA